MARYDGPLLFVDLETTGDDPRAPGASILEIGAILTRGPELQVAGRASMLIRPPGTAQDHGRIWATMPEVVRNMHSASGLWTEATTGDSAWALWEAEGALVRWLRDEHGALDGGPLALAGAGVSHLDLPWIKVHLPRLASCLLYWPMDFSPTRRILQYAGRDDLVDIARDVDAKPHRALADCELHVKEARHYLDLMRRIPAAEPVSS